MIKIGLLMLLMACSTINSRGMQVEVREHITSKDLEEYSNAGEVACVQHIFAVTGNYNRRLCIENMRNSAAEMGGVFIVIEKEVHLPGAVSTGREMSATVYKIKNAAGGDSQTNSGVDTE